MPIEPFYALIQDDSRRAFTVDGPMTDDRWLNDVLWDAREAGIPVSICRPPATIEKDVFILRTKERLQYEYVENVHDLINMGQQARPVNRWPSGVSMNTNLPFHRSGTGPAGRRAGRVPSLPISAIHPPRQPAIPDEGR